MKKYVSLLYWFGDCNEIKIDLEDHDKRTSDVLREHMPLSNYS